jgi:outer membrane immunogenic protein
MKKLSTLLTAIAAVAAVSAPALAADMRMPRKALPPPVAAVYNWTGFYIGGFVGGAFADGDATTTDPCLTGAACAVVGSYNGVIPVTYNLDSSFIGGGTIGYNWQSGQFVFGLEGEAGYMRVRGSSTFLGAPVGGDTVASTAIGDWYGVIAARLGWAFDRVLVYAKVGGVVSEVQTGVVDACVVGACGPGLVNTTAKDTVWGVAAGGGVEFAITNNWTVKGEYLWLDLADTQTNAAVGGGSFAGFTLRTTTTTPSIHTAKFGVNYKF